ncbi:MAG: hypothetical protein AVDCRST_MAG54-799, partial [uncultured Actinomycetospora sp.]
DVGEHRRDRRAVAERDLPAVGGGDADRRRGRDVGHRAGPRARRRPAGPHGGDRPLLGHAHRGALGPRARRARRPARPEHRQRVRPRPGTAPGPGGRRGLGRVRRGM